MNRFAIVRAILSSAILVAFVGADDQPVTDPDLPQPLDASETHELLAHSPFTRSVNLADTLQLTGIASVEGRPVATFLNTETKQSFTVSEEPNAQGWKLTEASPSTELRDSEVTLQVGSETVTMHYGDAQLSPGVAKKGLPTTYLGGSNAGSKSNGDERIKTSAYLGGDGKALYASLSSEAREKLKDLINARIEKKPESTMEQRSDYARKIFASLKASDQKAAAENGDKNKKSSKAAKFE